MKLLFKQRFFSWFDSYDIYDESGNTVYTVEGKFAWGHLLHINDAGGAHVATVKQELLTFLPKFSFYINDSYIGCIKTKFTFFMPVFYYDFNDWTVKGDVLGWNYSITDSNGIVKADVGKELFNFTDTYTIDVYNPSDALLCLMTVLAIDAKECSERRG